MKFLAVLGLAFMTTASAVADEKSDTEGAFMLCVRQMAVRFEPSGESPQSIAEAAYIACLDKGVAAINVLLRDPNPGISPIGLEESAKGAAIAQVVWARLCRKTKDCAFEHIP